MSTLPDRAATAEETGPAPVACACGCRPPYYLLAACLCGCVPPRRPARPIPYRPATSRTVDPHEYRVIDTVWEVDRLGRDSDWLGGSVERAEARDLAGYDPSDRWDR